MFVFLGMLLAVAVLSFSGWLERLPLPLVSTSLALYLVLLCIVALILFNLFAPDPVPGVDFDTIATLEAKGLLVDTTYHAMRVFEVEEMEDEGRHFFLELDDGSVLYLNGQYLYDYDTDVEEHDDDEDKEDMNEDENIPRGPFPCTVFTVRRHKDDGRVVDIDCIGIPLRPETIEPPFSPELFDVDWVPSDGDIITCQTYDDVKTTVRTGRAPER